ncbi:hypothetical protein R1flu_017897 [Riccia fluitans]|uniref:COMM domain-containing protein n=1 Tax=Riccia fluitans TaxID=41844 RepID=A0ABD1ZE99_9MARC
MKFSVCGGLDAPDWILAHMSTLAKISSGRIKIIAKHIIDHMLEGVFDFEKVRKLSRDSSLGESELKACIAVLHFFITNATKFDIDDSTLSKELQQLGLPKEHSDALCTPYLDNKDALQTKFLDQTLQIPALQIGAWQVQLGETKSVVMRLTGAKIADQIGDTNKDLQVCLTAEKFHLLLRELKTARSLLEEIS